MARSRRRPKVALVTLTTDMGPAYAAQMKAVLAQRLPPGHLIDLTHDLAPYAIGEAAFLLGMMGKGFPAGTVHLAVVDPGVGGRREPIAVRCRDGSVLVGPNNGVLVPLATALGGARAHRILRGRLSAGPRVGATFDGRDLFAPAAAAIALGTPPERLGPAVPFRPLAQAEPRRLRRGAVGEIVHVDRFGNLVTNVPTRWVPSGTRALTVTIGHRPPQRLPFTTHYEAAGRGFPTALGSSFGLIEIAVAQGNAAKRWRASRGTRVVLEGSARSRRATDRVNSVRTRRR